jgi:hypothetical protein
MGAPVYKPQQYIFARYNTTNRPVISSTKTVQYAGFWLEGLRISPKWEVLFLALISAFMPNSDTEVACRQKQVLNVWKCP